MNRSENPKDFPADGENADTGNTASLVEPAPVYALPLKAKNGKEKTFPVTRELFSVWAEAYPLVDVRAELREIKAWLVSNPRKRPTSDMPRFVNSWLGREQNDKAKAAARASPSREIPGIAPRTPYQQQRHMQSALASAVLQADKEMKYGDGTGDKNGIRQIGNTLPASAGP